jgi:O-antigen/teichoic acid export membrane protein
VRLSVPEVLTQRNVTQLVSITFVGRVVGRLFKYFLVVLIARGLGDDTLGTFALGFVLVQFGSTIANLGLESTMRKYVPLYREGGESGKLTGLLLGAILVSVVGGTAVAVGGWEAISRYALFPQVVVGDVVPVLLLSVPLLAVVRSLDAATLGYDRTKYSVYIRDFGQEGFTLLFMWVAIVWVGSDTLAASGYVAAIAATTVVAVVIVYRLGGFDGVQDLTIGARELASYSLVTTFSTLTQLTVLWVDVLVLSWFLARDLVGQYQAAYQTAALLTFSLVAANSIFPSLASRLYGNGETERLGRLYGALVKWIALFTLSAVISTVILSEEILTLFGESFQAASGTLSILALAQGVVAVVGPAGYLLLMTGRERLELYINLFVATLNTVLNVLLVPRFGIVGAAVATGFSLAVQNVIRFVAVEHFFGFYPRMRDLGVIVVPVLATGLVVFLVDALPLPPLATVSVSIVVAALVFMPLSYLLVLDESDSVLFEAM